MTHPRDFLPITWACEDIEPRVTYSWYRRWWGGRTWEATVVYQRIATGGLIGRSVTAWTKRGARQAAANLVLTILERRAE